MEPVEAGAGPGPVVVLRIGSTLLAVGASEVEEIAEPRESTPLPRAPVHIPGLVNLRGRAVPLLDLSAFLGLPAVAPKADAFPRITVVRVSGLRAGVLCDQVLGIDEPDPQLVRKPRMTANTELAGCAVWEIDDAGGLITVLDASVLLSRARVLQ